MAEAKKDVRQIPTRVPVELAEAVDAAVKARGIVKNDFMLAAIMRELAAGAATPEPECTINQAPVASLDATILEVVAELFKYLLPLREDMAPDEADRIKALFVRCRAAINAQPSRGPG